MEQGTQERILDRTTVLAMTLYLLGAITYYLPFLMLLLLAGCAPRSERPVVSVPLTERQRDSILARSGLPGAPVVGRALDVSDQAADHAAKTAAADSLFR
ncbi:MAG: hypothetical protein ACRENJ_09240 [Candidatus Eiseniibacteriota bacterium]